MLCVLCKSEIFDWVNWLKVVSRHAVPKSYLESQMSQMHFCLAFCGNQAAVTSTVVKKREYVQCRKLRSEMRNAQRDKKKPHGRNYSLSHQQSADFAARIGSLAMVLLEFE